MQWKQCFNCFNFISFNLSPKIEITENVLFFLFNDIENLQNCYNKFTAFAELFLELICIYRAKLLSNLLCLSDDIYQCSVPITCLQPWDKGDDCTQAL